MATTTTYLQTRNVREATFTLTYEDTTPAVMFTLPAGARIIDYIFNVTTAFSGGTTSAYVGTSSTGNELVNGVSVAATGKSALTTQLADPGHETTALTDVYGSVGASNTAGEVEVTILYSLQRDTRK